MSVILAFSSKLDLKEDIEDIEEKKSPRSKGQTRHH